MEMHIQRTDQTRKGAQSLIKPSFPGMVRGELIKMMWLRSTWIMLALLISGTAAVYLLNASDLDFVGSPVKYAYDFVLSENFVVFRMLSGYTALLMTAFAIGLEYQQGTIRVILGRGVGRVQFLLSKIVALFLMAVLVQLGGVILNGVLLIATTTTSPADFNALEVILSNFTGIFTELFLYMLFNMWVSILLAAAVTVLGRSLTFGLSIALLWFPLENIAARLLPAVASRLLPNDLALNLSTFLLGPNLNAMPGAAISQRILNQVFVPSVPVSGAHTIAVALVYSLIFLVIAIVFTRYRNIEV